MNRENKITIGNLIYAVLFLVLGILLLTTSNDIISIVSKVIGAVLIIVGIVKSIIYIYMKGKLGNYELRELLIGLLIICTGILFILYSSALGFAIRTIIGIWTLFAGISRMIYAISVKQVDIVGFRMYLSTSFVMFIVGLLLISGMFDKMIGILIIIYAISEIVDYIYFICKGKSYEKSTDVKKETKTQKKVKKLKNTKVVDAIIEEEK